MQIYKLLKQDYDVIRERNMKLLNVNLLVIAFIALSSCKPASRLNVEKELYAKYGEKFKVYEDTYSYVLKTYQFQASPVNNKQILFVGNHNKDFSAFSDAYVQNYLSHKFGEYVKNEIEKYTKPVYVHTEVYFTNRLEIVPKTDTIDIHKILQQILNLYHEYQYLLLKINVEFFQLLFLLLLINKLFLMF